MLCSRPIVASDTDACSAQVQLTQLWSHVDQLNNGRILKGEFLFRSAPSVVPRSLRWDAARLRSLHAAVRPREVPAVGASDFRRTLTAAGIEKHWLNALQEAGKRSSVFEAAAALVRQHGTASSGMAVTREEFEQWCKLSGFGPHPMSAREWRALCKRARESQRRRVPAVWRAVLLERRVGPQGQTSGEPKNDRAACMAAAELQEVLARLGLPLDAEKVGLLLRKAAARAGGEGERVLSQQDFAAWLDAVTDVQLALAQARLQRNDVGSMLRAQRDAHAACPTPTTQARIETLEGSEREVASSVGHLERELLRQGGDVLPCAFSSLHAVGVAETLPLVRAELRLSQAEFIAAARPVPGGSTEIGAGGTPQSARGEEREEEILELWTFLDKFAVGFVDVATFEQRLGGRLPAGRARARLPPHLAREWEGPSIDALRKRICRICIQRLWRELLQMADPVGGGRGQVEYKELLARCRLRHGQAGAQPAGGRGARRQQR